MQLDYLSCILTILSTALIGRRMWQGWIVAGVNSVILCIIGLKTTQFGLIPANLFCLGMYAFNVSKWRITPGAQSIKAVETSEQPARHHEARVSGRIRRAVDNEPFPRKRDRVRWRALPGRR
jgi:hypothetical protein